MVFETVRADCGRIDHLPPHRLANRTPRTHHANTSFWRSRGARETCDLQAAPPANDRLDRAIAHGVIKPCTMIRID
eukprot:11168952-Lingulodinium_polyedra.AAC.1